MLVSCISGFGNASYCRRGMYSHCMTGGWILGHEIDGAQAEYVRIPHADTSRYPVPPGADKEALVMLGDILPTGFECGVLNGKAGCAGQQGRHIVGAGPIRTCCAANCAVLFAGPAHHGGFRREPAGSRPAFRCGQHRQPGEGDPAEAIVKLTDRRGVDTAIEAVGVPASFITCENIVAPGGTIAK